MSEPIANVDMANAWDGEEGDQWTKALYRSWMAARGLAASTIDRRLSTVCRPGPIAHLGGAQ